MIWESIEAVPCSFIDPSLVATESDLVFKFLRGEEQCYLYVLLEHQSTEDPFMPCRLARYILGIRERHRREHPEARRLPPVFPLVVYQGAGPWKSGTRLQDLIALRPGDANERWQLGLEFSLLELFRTGYEELKGTPEGVLALRVLKAEPVGELLSEAVWEAKVWRKLSWAALYRLMRYIVARAKSGEAVLRRIEKLKEPRLKEAYMTIAEQHWAEGRVAGHAAGHAAGREEGIREGGLGEKRRAVLRALEIRHGSKSNPPAPPLLEHIWERISAQVNAIDSGLWLDQLLEAAICSDSIQEFERHLPQGN